MALPLRAKRFVRRCLKLTLLDQRLAGMDFPYEFLGKIVMVAEEAIRDF